MNLEKQEIDEALNHERKMLRVLQQRLQQRQLQEAQYGLNAPPEIISEIADLTERILTHQAEIVRLQVLVAVGDSIDSKPGKSSSGIKETALDDASKPTIFLSDRTGFNIPIQKRLENAQNVCLLGLNLVNFVSQYQDVIEERAKAGCKFRIVILSPSFFKYKELFPGWHGRVHSQGDLEHSLRNLEHKKTSNVQIKFLSFPPPFSLLLINSDQPEGEIQVEMYTYEKSANKRPHFILTPSTDKKWFDFFKEEFEKAWEKSQPFEVFQ